MFLLPSEHEFFSASWVTFPNSGLLSSHLSTLLTVKFFFRELIPRSSSGSQSSSPEGDWLDMALVTYGGTFLESEVNELRAMRKVVVFSFLLIPYWMIYSQVKNKLSVLHVKLKNFSDNSNVAYAQTVLGGRGVWWGSEVLTNFAHD